MLQPKILTMFKSLEEDSIKFFLCFSNNQMKANYKKCQVLVNRKDRATIKLIDFEIENTECEKFLVRKVACELKFKY